MCICAKRFLTFIHLILFSQCVSIHYWLSEVLGNAYKAKKQTTFLKREQQTKATQHRQTNPLLIKLKALKCNVLVSLKIIQIVYEGKNV